MDAPPFAANLFAVIASGIKIIINGDPLTRRSRFILACSLALAFGVELVPQWATSQLWPVTPVGAHPDGGSHMERKQQQSARMRSSVH